MQTLYVIEPGSSLRKEGDCLKIVQGRRVVDTIPAAGLKQLTLAGRASISGAVLDFLVEHNIDTVFMTMNGRFRARLLLDDSGHTALRRHQYLRLSDPAYQQRVAAAIVRQKLENQSRLLLRRASQLGIADLRAIGAQIRALCDKSQQATGLDELRGVEGYGSRLYFSAFGLLIRNDLFRFTGRNRRPPLDPVNALLSFVYTLFTNEVQNGVKSAGLDPYCGALHEILPGRPSLACDLVEEWRPFAERLVLGLINRKAIRPEDFIHRSGSELAGGKLPVEMKPNAARALIAAYQRQLEDRLTNPADGRQTAVRWIIHGQCRHFAETLKTGEVYVPFQAPRSGRRMYYVVCFDISDNRVRYRVVKVLKGCGRRVQKSVFECPDLNEHRLLRLQKKLDDLIDHGSDSVRYYRLCRACVAEVEWIGGGEPPAADTYRIV